MTNATPTSSWRERIHSRYRADVLSDWIIASIVLLLIVFISMAIGLQSTGVWWSIRKCLFAAGGLLLLVGGVVALIPKIKQIWANRAFKLSALASFLALAILAGQYFVPAIGSVFASTSSQQGISAAQPPSGSASTSTPAPAPFTATPTPTPAPSTGQNGQAQGSSTGNRGSNPYFAESDNGTSGTGQQSSGSNGNTKQVVQPTPKAYETCYYTAYDAAKGSNNFGPRLKKETKQAAVDRAVWKIKNDCLWAATKVWMHDNKVSDPNKVDLNAVRSLAMKYDADPAKWRSDVARVNKDVKSVKFVKVSKSYSTLGMKTYSDGSMPTLLKSHESAAQGWTLVTTYHNGTVLQQRTACDFQFSIPDKA